MPRVEPAASSLKMYGHAKPSKQNAARLLNPPRIVRGALLEKDAQFTNATTMMTHGLNFRSVASPRCIWRLWCPVQRQTVIL